MFGQIQRKPYRRFDLDLGIARTAKQFLEVGSFIWVEECDGDVYIKLNDNQAAFFKLIDGAFYKISEYKQFWIKNTAQAGKSLKALIGDADFFRSVMRGNGKVGTKKVDETAIGDTKHLEFKTASGKIEYVDKPAGGAGGKLKQVVSVSGTTNPETESTAFVDATGVTVDITTSGSTKLACFFSGCISPWHSGSVEQIGVIALNVGGSDVAYASLLIQNHFFCAPIVLSYLSGVKSADTYTVKLRFKRAGSGTKITLQTAWAPAHYWALIVMEVE